MKGSGDAITKGREVSNVNICGCIITYLTVMENIYIYIYICMYVYMYVYIYIFSTLKVFKSSRVTISFLRIKGLIIGKLSPFLLLQLDDG